MTTRALIKIMLAVGVCVVLAFGYAALKYYRGKQVPETPTEVSEQAPVISTQEPQAPVPEPEPPERVHAPLEVKKAKPSIDPKDSAHAPSVPLHPDATAWEKVEYIRNNLHLYGTFHPDADAIIAQLDPPPENFLNAKSGFTADGEFIHDEAGSERVIALFDQLIPLNDPRSAELLARYLYEYGSGGTSWTRALVDLGAPSIPFLLEYAEDEVWDDYVAAQLKEIVNRHPDLDPDIVTDILEPLFEKNKRWLQQ